MAEIAPVKSICFFCSYYNSPEIPAYVKFYLSELKKHFTEVALLTNEKVILPDDLEFLNSRNIIYRLYKNEGFDFGMWYKALQEFNVSEYDRIGLVNDSCVLFNRLDFFFNWLDKEDVDYAGMTNCNKIQYHIQSYFIMMNRKAIPDVMAYFQANGIIENIHEVIRIYEVGLSDYLLCRGLKLNSFYSVRSIPFPFKNRVDGQFKGILMRYSQWKRYMCFKDMHYMADPTWYETKQLIREGMPMIKRKILTRSYGVAKWYYMIKLGFDPVPEHYIHLIESLYPDADSEILKSVTVNRGWIKEIAFYSYIFMAKCYYFLIAHKIYIVKRAIIIMSGKD